MKGACDKEVLRLIKRIRANGFIVEICNPHPKIRTKEGRLLGVLPRTAGDPRALKNREAELRRQGIL